MVPTWQHSVLKGVRLNGVEKWVSVQGTIKEIADLESGFIFQHCFLNAQTKTRVIMGTTDVSKRIGHAL